MSELGAARGSIVIDTSDVTAAAQRVRRGATDIQRSFNGIKTQAIDLTGVFNDLSGALGLSLGVAGIVQFGRAFNDMVQDAAQADRVRQSFDRLATGVGQSSDSMLESMRDASRGLISDADLIINANRAIIAGVADTAEEMGQLLEIARVRGQALGVSTQEAFTRLVQGIGKREKELLDELGIIVNLNDVYDDYAARINTTADELSEAQKTQAFFNAVLEDSAEILQQTSQENQNAADKIEQQKVAIDNLRQALGDLFVEGQTQSASFWTKMIDGLTEYVRAFQQIQNIGFGIPLPELTPSAAHGVRARAGGGSAGPRFTPDQESAIVQRATDLAALEKDTRERRVDAERGYRQSVLDVERDFQRTMTREAQDFATSRQRQEEDFQESILEIRQESARREAQAVEDLTRTLDRARIDSEERITELREDANKRLVELEQDYARDRERAQEEHQDRLLSAAGRLDAIAVLEERKRFARESRDAQEAHDEQRDDLKEQLQERIEDEREALDKSIRQANEAHEQMLEDAREADAQRLEDMQADFEERKRREDADRALRLDRMGEDHQARLDEMARQHNLDLQQIADHEQAKREKIEEEFNKESKLNDAWIKENRRVADAAIEDFTRAMDNIALKAAGLLGTSALTARGHPSEADPYVDRPFPSSARSSSRSSSALTINVYGAPGQSEERIGQIVAEKMTDFLEEVGAR